MKKLKAVFDNNSPFIALLLSVFLAEIGFGLYKGVLDNYLAEVVGATEVDKGITEFFRELPGALIVFLLALFYTASTEKLFKAGTLIMLAGMALHAIVPPEKILITVAIFVFSLGDHIRFGMRNTLTLNYAVPGHGGEALGYQSSVVQIGQLVGLIAVTLLYRHLPEGKAYKIFFYAALILEVFSLFFAGKLKGKSEVDAHKRRFYFHRKFRKYYMLEVFYGARKQVFFTFGPFVLILLYGADTTTISLLFAVSAVASFLLAPYVGKLIDRVGYKSVMVTDTLILVVVCFFYGFAHHIFPMKTAFYICCVNYILDSVISLASLASNVYVQDLSDSEDEMKMTISTGVSVNHVITIFIALFGGWIWNRLGVETLFILSAVLGLCNSAYAATIREGRYAKEEPVNR